MILTNNISVPATDCEHVQPNVRAVIDARELGKGGLYVHESSLIWSNDGDPSSGLQIQYPDITLHALSRDPTSYPFPCIYVMLDGRIPFFSNANGESNGHQNGDSDENESVGAVTELRFIPDDETVLDDIYNAITKCQELNPDPYESMPDDCDEDNGMFEDDDFEDDDNEAYVDAFDQMNVHVDNGEDDGNNLPDEAFEDAD